MNTNKIGRPKESDFAMVKLSIAPVRANPSDAAEMVSQLLFGECVEIVARKGKNWRKVRCANDGYFGWVDPKQLYFLTEKEYEKSQLGTTYSIELVHSITNEAKAVPIVIGSALHRFDGITAKLPNGNFTFNGQTIQSSMEFNKANMVVKLARKYLHAPYLWGGRSPFGIDCSGFTQIVYKMIGIKLPRDAKDQIAIGDTIDFVSQALPGDLAFFVNPSGIVHHVGIVLEGNRIIHASGCVRIDYLDHQGIFQQKRRAYTHQLRLIKRILTTD